MWTLTSKLRGRNETPEVEGFVSRPVIFLVKHKIYCGHYHLNGCFYDDRWEPHKQLGVANFVGFAEGMVSGRHDCSIVDFWCYLDDLETNSLGYPTK